MKRLKELRQSLGLTQEALAKALQTTQQTIARWETDKAEPNLSALRDLAMIFGTSVDDVVGSNRISKGHDNNLHPVY
jgi:transcriptional regulator with XRE-family HTH domain